LPCGIQTIVSFDERNFREERGEAAFDMASIFWVSDELGENAVIACKELEGNRLTTDIDLLQKPYEVFGIGSGSSSSSGTAFSGVSGASAFRIVSTSELRNVGLRPSSSIWGNLYPVNGRKGGSGTTA
jgi:hypothetical protein